MNEKDISLLLDTLLDKKINEKFNSIQTEIDEKLDNIINTANIKFDFIDKRLNLYTSNSNTNESNNLKNKLSFKTLLFLNLNK